VKGYFIDLDDGTGDTYDRYSQYADIRILG
jgi:hypothetical protein